MINLPQIQEDVFQLLLSLPQLRTVNMVLERKFIADQQVQMDALWQTPRNGRSGNGILIRLPEIEVQSSSVSGPPQTVILKFTSVQNGDAALLREMGGGFLAEDLEQTIIDALHLQSFGALGTIQAEGHFSGEDPQFKEVNSRLTKLRLKPCASKQTPRTAPVAPALSGGRCSLVCATNGAKVFYTLDGSFPANTDVAVLPLPQGKVAAPVNQRSKFYTAPFAVKSGQTVRAAAYADGMNPGEILNFPVP